MSRLASLIGASAVAFGLSACADSAGPLAQTAFAKGADNRIELSATFTLGDAKARYRSRGNQQELQIEVEDLVPGATVTFIVGGTAVSQTETVDAFGNVNLNLNTVDGDAVPAIGAGASVEAQVGGITVASGSF